MRVLIWILGVANAVIGLEIASSHGAAWQVFWWVFLGVWILAGLAVGVAWLARLAGRKAFESQQRRPAGAAPIPAEVKRAAHD